MPFLGLRSKSYPAPFRAAKKLAHYIGQIYQIEPSTESLLAEISMGAWEGKFWDQLDGPVFEAWKADPSTQPRQTVNILMTFYNASQRCAVAYSMKSTRVRYSSPMAGLFVPGACAAEQRSLEDIFTDPVDYGAIVPAR